LDDVIVVGAGPAGNNTALGLAARGYAVTVIDWRQNIGDKLCTGIVGQECIRRFPADPALVHREAQSARVVAPEGYSVQFQTKRPQASIIDRVGYVASFAHQAHAAGAGYRLGQRALQIIPDQQGVTVITGQGPCRARAVVLACGFGSPLTRQLGLGSVADYVTGIQALVATKNVEDVEIYLGQETAPGFFSWVVPTLPDHALVGLLSRRKAQAYLAQFLQRLRRDGRVADVIKGPACWGIPLRPLKRTYRDRILVVGDAAGQVKPTTGGGIYYSLLASEIAVDVLDKGLAADELSSEHLSQYQSRWKALLSNELEAGYSARRLYEFLTDQQISSLVRQTGTNGLHEELASSAESSFDWHSQIIAKAISHPVLNSVLRLVNPLLAKFAAGPDITLVSSMLVPIYGDPLANTSS
jgi:digeranylgeranylglycerophospholipid reductase